MQRNSSYSSVTIVAISIFFVCFFLNQGQQLFFAVFGRNLVPFSLIGVSLFILTFAALFGLIRSGRGVVLHEVFLFLML